MAVENEISSFILWFFHGEGGLPAYAHFALVVVCLSLLAVLVSAVVLLIRYGPIKAGEKTYRGVVGGLGELVRISPGRVLALAHLAVQESIRRRAFVVLVVFVFILVFASWFLSANNTEPAKLYLVVVSTTTAFLTLTLVLLLSAFSLPGDIKSKTIYTVVTKPVRAGDIVLGRILGFTAIGTVLMLVMAAGGYVFVNRSLSHTHTIETTSLRNILDANGESLGEKGTTSLERFHRHEVEIEPSGHGVALSEFGHEHRISSEADRLVVSEPRNVLQARVPRRGAIRFLDRQAANKERGISVGNEWTYRSFIEGGTSAAAIWTFTGINESILQKDADGAPFLPVELIVRVFRTHKGDIERPIYGSIQLRNPETGQKSSLRNFPAKDYFIDSFPFYREQFDAEQRRVDLLQDLVSSQGEIEVWVQCLERGQYYGFAQADCYVRLEDGSPLWNYVKGYLGLWAQMVIVISIGVMASTFLNGPVAALFTVSFILLGFFRNFFIGIATGIQPDGEKVYGGGPIEAFVRLITQRNLTTPFDEGPATSVMLGLDDLLQTMMYGVASVLPDFASLSAIHYVAEGFNIPAAVVGRELIICFAYVVGLSIAGYFLLRTREVAK